MSGGMHSSQDASGVGPTRQPDIGASMTRSAATTEDLRLVELLRHVTEDKEAIKVYLEVAQVQ